MIHYDITIKGKVYSVGYRKFVRQMANKYNISGYVKYNEDYSVHIEAEGEPEKLKDFMEGCRQGTNFTQIDELKFDEFDVERFHGFKILHRESKKNILNRIVNYFFDK